ncbi:M14 family zinc carboxypeptidase, partial [Gelatiniphilus marinus]
MKKTTLVSVLFMLMVQITFSQNTNKLKAENYLKERGELVFTFTANNLNEVKQLANIVSFDHGQNPKTPLTIKAIANENEFNRFLNFNLTYTINDSDNQPKERLMSNQIRKSIKTGKAFATPLSFPLTAYPTYQDYADQMALFASNNPSICELVDIGGTTEGVSGGNKRLLFIKLSDNVTTDEQEPKMMYTSSMHGDELAGYPLMLNLIDYFITAYNDSGHTDHARVKNLIDNSEIWINPLANPDGTFYNNPSNTSVANARRANDNGFDLNRNYPDNLAGPHSNGHTVYELETLHFMNFADAHHFVLSANFHGGVEVVNYPWDNTYDRHADDAWFQLISREYADNAQADSNGIDNGYMDDLTNGITHGADWYRVDGGRQDYMNFSHQCKETTIELSNNKTPFASELNNLWNFNKEALIDYLVQGTYGFRGVVKDANTNNPIEATITLVGHDAVGSHTVSEANLGDYYRPVKAGTYNILFEADCYQSFTLTNQTIADYQTVNLADVLLTPITSAVPTSLTASSINSTFATMTWSSASGATFDLRYREIGSPTWIDVLGISSSTSDLSGLSASTNYEVQVRSVCDSSTSAYTSSTNFSTTAVSYCASSGNTSFETGITRVIFNTIDNADGSPKDTGYEDFTNISTTVTQSSTYNLTVHVDTDGNFRVDAIAWIDWNQNGNFTDSGESYDLGNITGVSDSPISTPLSINIPPTASLGSTRMRISARYNANPTSCQNSFDGEVEDYTINITSNLTTWYQDADGDTFGNPLVSQVAASQPAGYVADNTDCDDTPITGASINPNTVWYLDADNDNYAISTTTQCTSPGAGYTTSVLPTTDCNDNDNTVNTPQQYYVDADGDGFGSTTTAMLCSSTAPIGYSDNNTDCNDNDNTVNTPQQYYVDADGDGFGSTTTAMLCSSTAPIGYSDNNTDCNDNDNTVN